MPVSFFVAGFGLLCVCEGVLCGVLEAGIRVRKGSLTSEVVLRYSFGGFFTSISLLRGPALGSLPITIYNSDRGHRNVVLTGGGVTGNFNMGATRPVFRTGQGYPRLIVLPPLCDRCHGCSRGTRRVCDHCASLVRPFNVSRY